MFYSHYYKQLGFFMIEKSISTSDNTELTFITQTTPPIINTDYCTAVDTSIQLEIGSVIKDTFELVDILGNNGIGTVFKALNRVWQANNARDPYVAIKIIKPEFLRDEGFVTILVREFEKSRILNCPNTINFYDFNICESLVYITMEYIEGKNLHEYLNHTPMTLPKAWFIIEGIGNALAHAHEQNIAHQDIKPRNILITHNNLVKVLGFDTSSYINENINDETNYNLGAYTPAYSSPEMKRGLRSDARDDIYSLACVIYEILTGKQFYKQNILKAATIRGLNSRQMNALNKALAFERDQRTDTVRELLDKLQPVKTPHLISALKHLWYQHVAA